MTGDTCLANYNLDWFSLTNQKTRIVANYREKPSGIRDLLYRLWILIKAMTVQLSTVRQTYQLD